MRLPSAPLVLLLAIACEPAEVAPPPLPPPVAPPAPLAPPLSPPPSQPVSRADWNRNAVRLNLPFFWVADTNGNGVADADEVRRLFFYPASSTADLGQVRDAIVHYDADALPSGLAPDEVLRRRLVLADLDQGAPTLLARPIGNASAADRAFVSHMVRVAADIDLIKGTMSGARALESRVPADDPASQSLFRRDWGPHCAGAKTRENRACSAIPGSPPLINDAYPAALQADAGFCAKLEKRPDAKVLLDPFSVIREVAGKLVSVPYHQAYEEPMRRVASELRAAADDETDASELALKAYLLAAAQSFSTNDWNVADEAWSRMNAQNSRWYLRVGPDEVLSDPCSQKAQFHLTLAHIDQGSLEWQKKLTPLEGEMERAIAALVGPLYRPRHVAFHLPDFIQIALNAGDDRAAMRATAGQSLPNWGKVEREGRGRTVVMTNIGTDPDSRAVTRQRLESLVVSDVMKGWTDAQEPALLGTILHEATHNLGPTYTYVFQGKRSEAVFGGTVAAMLEELKAETGALFYLDWLEKKGLVSAEVHEQAIAAWLAWALRHVATGVHSGGEEQPYSQLSAIQVGFLMDEGALSFDATAMAANGADKGAFAVQRDKLGPAVHKLMTVVAGVLARNDKPGAEALLAKYVDGPVVPQATIAERTFRSPQETYVYSLDP